MIEWFALVELDVVRGGLGDRVIRVDLDAGLLEQVAQRLLDFRIVAGEDLLERFDEVDLDRRAVIVAELRDFAGGLDAREARTADDDLCGIAARRFLARFGDGLVDLEGVVEALQRQGVLLETGDAVVGGLAAETDKNVVVINVVAVGEFDGLLVDIETGNFVLNEPGRRIRDPVDRERDVRADVRIPDHAVRFVQNEVIVDIGDPCQPSVAFELRLELVDRTGTGVASTEHDDVLSHMQHCETL